MKIFYDGSTNNIIIEGLNRFFPSSSLIATGTGNNVGINYLNSSVLEVFDNFSNFQKSDGSPAGANVGAVVDYLNAEFAKGGIAGNSSFSGLSTTKTITDARIKAGDKIIPSPQSATLNEFIFVSSVADGSFVVSRVIINALGALTSALNFNWFRI